MKPAPVERPDLDRTAALTLLALSASWGLGQVAVKVGNAGISPVAQAALRALGSTALVLLWARLRDIPLVRRDGTLGYGLAVGALFAAEFGLLYGGLALTTAARGGVFLYTAPFVVALGTHLFVPGDRLTGVKAAGLLAAFGGVVLAFSESARLPSRDEMLGDLLCLAAAVLWGATTVLIKASPLVRAPAEKTLLYQLGVSAVALPIAAGLLGEPWVFRPTPLVLAALAYQTVLVASASYLAWFWLVSRYPASRLAAFSFLTPVFGVLFGGVLLGEPVGPGLIVSVGLLAAGIYLVNRPTA